MFRMHTIAVALFLMAALALSGCAQNTPSFLEHKERYYGDYSDYRQAQWDRFNQERVWKLEREGLAKPDKRLQLERERLEWERRETERLNHEEELRAQWKRDKARQDQQRREQEELSEWADSHNQVSYEQQRREERQYHKHQGSRIQPGYDQRHGKSFP